MFFKKKETKKEEVIQPTVIYQRLERLCKVLSKIQSDDKIDIVTHDGYYGYLYTRFYFKSNLGRKYIEILHDNYGTMTYIDMPLQTIRQRSYTSEYTLSYYNSPNDNSPNDKIFTLDCLEYSTQTNPYFTKYSLTAHDIDMAIYEIEEYIRNKYGTLEEIEKYNIQQIGILEGGI